MSPTSEAASQDQGGGLEGLHVTGKRPGILIGYESRAHSKKIS